VRDSAPNTSTVRKLPSSSTRAGRRSVIASLTSTHSACGTTRTAPIVPRASGAPAGRRRTERASTHTDWSSVRRTRYAPSRSPVSVKRVPTGKLQWYGVPPPGMAVPITALSARSPAATPTRDSPGARTPSESSSGARSVSAPRTSSTVALPARPLSVSVGTSTCRSRDRRAARAGKLPAYSVNSRGAARSWRKPSSRSAPRVSTSGADEPSGKTTRARPPGGPRKRTVTGSPAIAVMVARGDTLPISPVSPVRPPPGTRTRRVAVAVWPPALAVTRYTPSAGTGMNPRKAPFGATSTAAPLMRSSASPVPTLPNTKLESREVSAASSAGYTTSMRSGPRTLGTGGSEPRAPSSWAGAGPPPGAGAAHAASTAHAASAGSTRKLGRVIRLRLEKVTTGTRSTRSPRPAP
jgi:hypothetical protein